MVSKFHDDDDHESLDQLVSDVAEIRISTYSSERAKNLIFYYIHLTEWSAMRFGILMHNKKMKKEKKYEKDRQNKTKLTESLDHGFLASHFHHHHPYSLFSNRFTLKSHGHIGHGLSSKIVRPSIHISWLLGQQIKWAPHVIVGLKITA